VPQQVPRSAELVQKTNKHQDRKSTKMPIGEDRHGKIRRGTAEIVVSETTIAILAELSVVTTREDIETAENKVL